MSSVFRAGVFALARSSSPTGCRSGVGGRITTHGLRRTLNNLTRQVSTGEVVRSIIGHSTERMTEHYSWIELDEKRAAITGVLRLVEGSAPDRSADESDDSCDTPADGNESAG